MEKVDIRRVERAARLYASNQEASLALGIALGTFGRLCREHGIQTPHARRLEGARRRRPRTRQSAG